MNEYPYDQDPGDEQPDVRPMTPEEAADDAYSGDPETTGEWRNAMWCLQEGADLETPVHALQAIINLAKHVDQILAFYRELDSFDFHVTDDQVTFTLNGEQAMYAEVGLQLAGLFMDGVRPEISEALQVMASTWGTARSPERIAAYEKAMELREQARQAELRQVAQAVKDHIVGAAASSLDEIDGAFIKVDPSTLTAAEREALGIEDDADQG